MSRPELLSKATELALDLLEKRGGFLPFCKAETFDGQPFVYTPETGTDGNFSQPEAEAHLRKSVIADIVTRQFVGLAFCKDVNVTLANSDRPVDAIRVELHHVDGGSLIYWFPYLITDGKAATTSYYTGQVEPIALWRELGTQ